MRVMKRISVGIIGASPINPGWAVLAHIPAIKSLIPRLDPYFIPAGAEAFRRDNPNATVRLLDTVHFALETHMQEIADAMRALLVVGNKEGE